ncbi:MAG: LamG domain-containing protein [Deltaproteobacteria bacterium]|nr:LamG domain-containing protein [Deltaproteobacteria bacterium]
MRAAIGLAGVLVLLASCDSLDEFESEDGCPALEPRCRNRAPTEPMVRILPEKPGQGESLACQATATDPDGDSLTLTYSWTRNGSAMTYTSSAVPARVTMPDEDWSCIVVASDGLLTSTSSTTTRIRAAEIQTWLREHTGGWCANEYNQFMNLCGDVVFCESSPAMRTYPDGLSLDFGFHWGGSPGVLMDLGGDCDGKRLSFVITERGQVSVEPFMGSERLTAHVEPGTRLISYRATPRSVALYVDGVLADSAPGTSSIPELVARCGPGLVLGQRLSYWWEENKRDSWLRFAPFFFHLRARASDELTWSSSGVFGLSDETVLLFEPAGVARDSWQSMDGVDEAYPNEGMTWVDPIFTECIVENRPPTAPVVAIEPALPSAGQALSCTVVTPSADFDGEAVTYSYRWTKDGTLAPFSTARIPEGVTETGTRWTCTVTPSDGMDNGLPASASEYISGAVPCHSIKLTGREAGVSFVPTGYGFGGQPWTLEAWLQSHDEFPLQAGLFLTSNELYVSGAFQMAFEPQGGIQCAVYDDVEAHRAATEFVFVADGRWHHVACSFDGSVLSAFIDGTFTSSAAADPQIVATSPLSLGRREGSLSPAAPVSVGPIRISRAARYADRFQPTQRWSIDADTVSQYLVSSGLAVQTIADEAGGDNDGVARSGVVEGLPGECP